MMVAGIIIVSAVTFIAALVIATHIENRWERKRIASLSDDNELGENPL